MKPIIYTSVKMSGNSKSLYRRAPLIALCVLAGFVLVGCSSDRVYLPALKADPMASYSHPDLDLEARLHSPKHKDWLGGEQGSDIWTLWTVRDGADVDAVIADVLRDGEEVGWAFETLEPAPTDRGDTYWRAEKYLNEGLAGLTVHLDPSPHRGGVEVSMWLDFVEEDVATPVLIVERDASYEAPEDLRDAIEAIGVRCSRFTSEVRSDPTRGPGISGRCNESVTMRMFDTHEEAQGYQQHSIDSAESSGRVYLVGPNWILGLDKNVELAAYIQGELGGELVVTGGGA